MVLEAIIDRIRSTSPQLFRSWFDTLRADELNGGVLRIMAMNDAQCRYLNGRCQTAFIEAAQHETGHLVSVSFQSDGEQDRGEIERDEQTGGAILDEERTFDRFMEGESNRLAVTAARAIADLPLESPYRPLYVYGPSQVGKTHLLQAICHHALKHGPHRAAYVDSDTFTRNFVVAIEEHNESNFRRRFDRIDLLALDDVQKLSRRERTQGELFRLFTTFMDSGKQIVLAANREPAQLEGVEPRLTTRFSSGLVVAIDPPTFEMRLALLRIMVAAECLDFSPLTLEILADKIRGNVSELREALCRVERFAYRRGVEVTPELVDEALTAVPQGNVELAKIIDLVAVHFGVSKEELIGPDRSGALTYARQIAMYLARRFGSLTPKAIGLTFGGRSASTVTAGIRAIHEARKAKPKLSSLITTLTDSLESTCA